jgi:hypothetical protein
MVGIVGFTIGRITGFIVTTIIITLDVVYWIWAWFLEQE